MTRIVADGLAVCVDCAHLVAKGEGSDALAAAQVAVWGADAAGLVLVCPEDCDGWFSWNACDGCGSTLGGDRHSAAVLSN